MKIQKIKSSLTKAIKAELYYNRVINQLLTECQKCCDFELAFCEWQQGDGFCLGYEDEKHDNNLISVDSFIRLVSKSKKSLKLSYVEKTF